MRSTGTVWSMACQLEVRNDNTVDTQKKITIVKYNRSPRKLEKYTNRPNLKIGAKLRQLCECILMYISSLCFIHIF